MPASECHSKPIHSMIVINANEIPRLPLKGEIDLTYRCNNHCRHCWVRLPAHSRVSKNEFSFTEIRQIADEARSMGCNRWSISGGEPILRLDFPEIFDYLTRKAVSYSLNTNGTLITPSIARLLKRKGTKMVAFYGASAEVHDHITRNPGSFEDALRGVAYLKEAGAGFIVQLIPMRDNFHQWPKMIQLAKSLSPQYRVGAPWLYLTACGSAARNREIIRQRLASSTVVSLDEPDLFEEEKEAIPVEIEKTEEKDRLIPTGVGSQKDKGLFADCIESRRDFHIDSYGQMSFCCYIKDTALRYNLRQGTFTEAWGKFIPSLIGKVRGGKEYMENCGACRLNDDCRWCPAYGYLEHRRFSAKVEYLCGLARENRQFKEIWRREHRQYYQIAGVTIQVESDLPITDQTFAAKFKIFQVAGPGADIISVRHHFALPQLSRRDMGRQVYRKLPWAIYRRGRSWIYTGISPPVNDGSVHHVAVFNEDLSRGRIYNNGKETFQKGNLQALTMFPSDQILLALALADRQACFFHAAGMDIGGMGLLIVGHSGAGKTTAATMMKKLGKVLCDDRIIVRRQTDGLRIHGTWSHGDLADVSARSAPLSAILFLEKADATRLVPVTNRFEISRLLAQHVIKSLVTVDWWQKVLTLIEEMAQKVPTYRLEFDKSGRMVDAIVKIL
jgi:MoaA/NifB/PqqE/SkfB family radical SAM enzyme